MPGKNPITIWIHLGPVGSIHLGPVGPIHLGPGPGPIGPIYLGPDPMGPFYVSVTNGVKLKDGELSGTSIEAEFRYAPFMLIFMFSQKTKRFSDVGAFHDVWTFLFRRQIFFHKSAPEVFLRSLGPSPTNAGPFWTNFGGRKCQSKILKTILYSYIIPLVRYVRKCTHI